MLSGVPDRVVEQLALKTSDKPKSNTQAKSKTADKPKAAAKPAGPKDAREALIASTRDKQAAAPDPLAMLEPKKLAVRIGIPLALAGRPSP